MFAARRITRALEAEGHEGLVKAFGAREAAAGVAILARPSASAGVWSRVAGDAIDMAALALAARRAPRNRAVWGSIAFVAGAAALDAAVALGLDRRTEPRGAVVA